MKKILYILLAVLLLATSCNEWLNVESEGEIIDKDAFSSGDGYRTALVGIYRQMGSTELWGKEMTWGFMSVIGRNYDKSSLPMSYATVINNSDNNIYYEDTYSKASIAGIWEKAYNTIANCNNLLKSIEDKDESFFEYSWEKDMIVAEAKAVRATLHFELLRLFVPAPSTGYTGKAIPYVKDYPVIHPEYLDMKDVMANIIGDLEYAIPILKNVDIDVLFKGQGALTYISTILYNGFLNLRTDGTYGNGSGFFSFRGFRMNYWSTSAMLARVYSYKRDNASAVKIIDELLEEWGGANNFDWCPNQANTDNMDGKRFPETLCAFWNSEEYKIYEKVVNNDNTQFKVHNMRTLFGMDITSDYRYVSLYDTESGRYRVWEKPEDETQSTLINYRGPLLPVLELSELHYIRCEYLAEQGDIQGALAMLKNVKDARNVLNIATATDYDSFMELLVNDATRDFITRGQTWNYLKKLNWKKMYNGTPVYWDVPDEWFVLPIPDSEKNYY